MDTFNTILSTISILSVALVSEIVAIVCSVIMGVYWLVAIALKLYNALKDGKLSDEEIKDISESVEKLQDVVSKLTDHTDDDE